MVDQYKARFSELIDSILSHLPKNASPLMRDFVAHYYAKMPLMDLLQMDAKRACKIAQHSYGFFEQKTNPLNIRVFKPNEEDHGWKANYLVVEVHSNDTAFILDSLTAELTRQGFNIFETIHPVIYLNRDKSGKLKKLADLNKDGELPTGVHAESFIHFQLSSMPEGMTEEILIKDLHDVMDAVGLVVNDWQAMDLKAKEVIKRLGQLSKYVEPDDIQEAKDFLQWLCDKNFVFMGQLDYDFYDADGNECLEIVEGSELGIFKTKDDELRPRGLSALPPEIMAFAREPKLIEVTKSNRKSTVHRPVLMDYISIKRFSDGGKVIGETRFLGLFTSTVYYQSAEHIPYIRRKIARTLIRANFDPLTHSGKQLKAILEFYPRDELFQISEDELLDFSIGLMSLEAKPDVRLFVRRDRFERFISCMVYIPRERFSTYLREQISTTLTDAYKGEITAFYTQMTDSPLARVHLIIATEPGKIPNVDLQYIEAQIARITNQWADSLREQLLEHYSEEDTETIAQTFVDAFPESYIQQNDAKDAVNDIIKIHQAIGEDGLAIELFRRKREPKNQFHLKIYTYDGKRALSDMLPMLENMGCKVLEVTPFNVTPRWKQSDILIRDFVLRIDENSASSIDQTKQSFEDALSQIWRGVIANDSFNSLVLLAGLQWREVLVIRAYSQYLRQIGFPYSQSYVAEALGKHPEATRLLIDGFFDKFSLQVPDSPKEDGFDRKIKMLGSYLENVSNISEDRIIRRFIDLMKATLRTNFFQTTPDGSFKSYVSFKFRSDDIPDMPQPTPYAEIFVYSMETEGIHLRGGPVARGGLRWSDRPEDFRTEVLGLMKAQMVKNSVIVPQGSKGGFIVKNPPPADAGRDAFMESGISSYKEFLRGLLDITDNLIDGKVMPPQDVIRHDGDDPYLVVAADKGTATFSDIANSISEAYGFWLDDAFASGGSAGYDHKAMGITAKGAWVSVTRHFAEMGVDIDKEDFTVAGIGDMSGDVFGNGMLLSKHIRLVAAFNHMHIFLDPNPDAATSFKERQRLFDMGRSSWTDYDEKLISKGGGIYPRDQKSIDLSKEVRELLDLQEKSINPDSLIQHILKSQVDLLWNGGIGTYVKATTESHDDAGDRANNALRINGEELRAKIVGEGGNLGFTQLGRIEYSRTGGRINTDSIDNSAGVDCSDHEVNIKIALQDAIAKGKLNRETRNVLLESMTDDVSRLVLIDNRLQAQAITIAEHKGFNQLEAQARLMESMENEGFLDREVEYLPNEKQLNELRAARKGLTRPELAILLSYSKMSLYKNLQNSSMAQSDYFIADLLRYFPTAMQDDYKSEILAHRLRSDIVATIVTNSIVNRAGITFAHSLIEENGMHPCDLARSYVITRDAFKLRELWASIEALDATVSGATQAAMFNEISAFMERTCLWFFRNYAETIDIEKAMNEYADGIATYAECYETLISKTLSKAYAEQVTVLTKQNVPESVAKRVAGLEVMFSACDVVNVANRFDLDVAVAGRVYFELGAQMRLGWLRRCADSIQTESYWDRIAIKSLIGELYLQQRRLTAHVVATLCDDNSCDFSVEKWYEDNAKDLDRYHAFINDLKSQDYIDMSMLVVAVRQAESICSVD